MSTYEGAGRIRHFSLGKTTFTTMITASTPSRITILCVSLLKLSQ